MAQAIQTIKLNVAGEPNGSVAMDAPNSGDGGNLVAWLNSDLCHILLAVGGLILLMVLTVIIIKAWRRSRIAHPSSHFILSLGPLGFLVNWWNNFRFSHRKISILIQGGLAGLVILPAIAIIASYHQPIIAAGCSDPICVSADSNQIDLAVDKDNSNHNTDSATTVATVTTENLTGYTLAAKLASASNLTELSGITFKLSGGGLTNPVVLGGSNQTVKSASEYSGAGIASNYTLAVEVSDTAEPGDYEIDLVYDANYNAAPNEQILFTINTTDGTYSIPTSGRVAGMNHAYDWNVTVDGVPVTSSNATTSTSPCNNGNCVGTSGTGSTTSDGIALAGLSGGQHQIRITPHATAVPGWGNAFGHYNIGSNGANATANKQKFIAIDASLTTGAFAPKTTESTANVSYMFANLFYGCSSLTTTATLMDTYKLPSSITGLSSFLYGIHGGNSQLTNPIDLTPLSGWFNNNSSITNLSSFLYLTHSDNSQLTNPIDLTPLSDWFNNNSSITNLSYFLYGIHAGNSQLTNPIDLTPLTDWFNDNSSMISLNSFLHVTHSGNTSLTTTIDLTPLTDWFNNNSSITNLSSFLYLTHNNNTQLTNPINLTPLSGWFNSNSSMTDLSSFLSGTHSGNTSLTTTIDLTPLQNWFYHNESITNLSSFFGGSNSSYFSQGTHYGNTSLTTTIDLTPLQNWFYHNESITNLSYFLAGVHYENRQLTNPIDLTPLTDWFYHNESITNLSAFLSHSYSHVQLTNPIDLTLLQNWFYHNESMISLTNFLSGTHAYNTQLTNPIDLTPLTDWFYHNESITDLGRFLTGIHSGNSQLTNPISLTPLIDWFYNNNSITNLSYFLSSVHRGSNNLSDIHQLTNPIDLTPLQNWFYHNESIANLSSFLSGVHHGRNQLTIPISLIPLADWFSTDRSFASVYGFLSYAHYYNTNLQLTGQVILPDWVKTAKQGAIPIYDADQISSSDNFRIPFYYTFSLSSAKTGDTAEPKFQDGTPLSSLGIPSKNLRTYYNRSDITPINSNWQ
jgi:hypothetical protein